MASKGPLFRTLLLGAWVGATAAPARAHNFVGAESCKSCHSFAYEVWAQSAHARAHQSLTPEQLGDGRCASCHSNVLAAIDPGAAADGSGEGGGQTAVGERDQKRSALAVASQDPALVGVQCEQCHGAGKLYQPDYVMRDRELSRALGLLDPTAAGCLACHTEGAPSLEPFDYRTMWGRIDHGRAARERYEAKLRDAAAPALETDEVKVAPAATLPPQASPPVRPKATSRRSKRQGR